MAQGVLISDVISAKGHGINVLDQAVCSAIKVLIKYIAEFILNRYIIIHWHQCIA